MQAADDFGGAQPGDGPAAVPVCDLSQAKAEASWLRCQALRPKLAVFLRAMLPDHHAVDDCLQDTFVLMAQRYPDAAGEDLSPLAFTCARNKALSWLAKNRVGKLSIIDPEVLGKIAETAAQLEEQDPVEYPARVSALRECLGRLPAEQRALIDARYGGDPNGALASLAGESARKLPALYKQLERLRGALKRCVTAKLAPRE